MTRHTIEKNHGLADGETNEGEGGGIMRKKNVMWEEYRDFTKRKTSFAKLPKPWYQ